RSPAASPAAIKTPSTSFRRTPRWRGRSRRPSSSATISTSTPVRRPAASRRAFGMRSLPKRSSVAGFVLAMSDGNPGSPTLAMVAALPNSRPARRLGVVALAFLYGLPRKPESRSGASDTRLQARGLAARRAGCRNRHPESAAHTRCTVHRDRPAQHIDQALDDVQPETEPLEAACTRAVALTEHVEDG